MKKAHHKETRRKKIWVATGTAAAVAAVGSLVAVALANDPPVPAAGDIHIENLQEYDGLSAKHLRTQVDYEQAPPVSGNHSPVWLNCGVYTEPVPDESAVHSLEHGSVWVTYDPAVVEQEQIEALRDELPDTYTILSPLEGTSSPSWPPSGVHKSVSTQPMTNGSTASSQNTGSPRAPPNQGHRAPAGQTPQARSHEPTRRRDCSAEARQLPRRVGGSGGCSITDRWMGGRPDRNTCQVPRTAKPRGRIRPGHANHHAQAVQMSFIVRERTDSQEIRQLAYDIARTQQQQAGQMHGWLAIGGLPQASPQPPMAWVADHQNETVQPDAEHHLMPGMATPAQINRLESRRGVEAERHTSS